MCKSCALSFGRQHHEHGAALHIGSLFNLGDILQFFGDFFQIFERELGVGDFTPAETDGNADFHPTFKPPTRVTHFETLMVIAGFGTQTNLFDLNLCLRFACFAFLFFFFVKELAVVDNLANWGFGVGCDLDQVQPDCVGSPKGVVDGDYPRVFTILVNKTDLLGADAFIYSIFWFAANLLFSFKSIVIDRCFGVAQYYHRLNYSVNNPQDKFVLTR